MRYEPLAWGAVSLFIYAGLTIIADHGSAVMARPYIAGCIMMTCMALAAKG